MFVLLLLSDLHSPSRVSSGLKGLLKTLHTYIYIFELLAWNGSPYPMSVSIISLRIYIILLSNVRSLSNYSRSLSARWSLFWSRRHYIIVPAPRLIARCIYSDLDPTLITSLGLIFREAENCKRAVFFRDYMYCLRLWLVAFFRRLRVLFAEIVRKWLMNIITKGVSAKWTRHVFAVSLSRETRSC